MDLGIWGPKAALRAPTPRLGDLGYEKGGDKSIRSELQSDLQKNEVLAL